MAACAGWWIAAALVLAALAVAGLQYYRGRHRRAALGAVRRLQAALEQGAEPVGCLQRLSTVLRRYAMTTADAGVPVAHAPEPSGGACRGCSATAGFAISTVAGRVTNLRAARAACCWPPRTPDPSRSTACTRSSSRPYVPIGSNTNANAPHSCDCARAGSLGARRAHNQRSRAENSGHVDACIVVGPPRIAAPLAGAPFPSARSARPRSALKVPVAAEFADLAGLRAPHNGRVWRLAALTAIWVLAVLAAARPRSSAIPSRCR